MQGNACFHFLNFLKDEINLNFGDIYVSLNNINQCYEVVIKVKEF